MERIQLRRDTSERWTSVNPVLMEGEVGIETDTKLRKVGDGVNHWNDLDYLAAENITQELGDSETAAISQVTITKNLNYIKDNNIGISNWGNPVVETEKLIGFYQIVDNNFVQRSNFTTKFYDLSTLGKNIILDLYAMGTGYYIYGFLDNSNNILTSISIPTEAQNTKIHVLKNIYLQDVPENSTTFFVSGYTADGDDVNIFDINSNKASINKIMSGLKNKLDIYWLSDANATITYGENYNSILSNCILKKDMNYLVRFSIDYTNSVFRKFLLINENYQPLTKEYINFDEDYITFTAVLDSNKIGIVVNSEDIISSGDLHFSIYDANKGFVKDILGTKKEVFYDDYNEVQIVTSKVGFFTTSLSWSNNNNYYTDYYSLPENIQKYVIKGEDYGSGILTYGYSTNNTGTSESVLFSKNMNSSSIEEVEYNLELDNIPSNANYIFVTRRVSNPKYLYIKESKSLPNKNKEDIDNLKSSIFPKYLARVIEYTDSVEGTEYTDNNVNRTFNMLQVLKRYNTQYNLMICFGLNGPNGMFGIRGWRLVENTGSLIFPNDNSFVEAGETVGPWIIESVNNPVQSSNQQFTGGFHGLINPDTNNYYPSARNIEINYYIDGKKINTGETMYGEDILCISKVNICSYNTFNKESNTAREVLEYIDSYQLINDKIYLYAKFKALENININLHYGMQIDKMNPYIFIHTNDGIRTINSSIEESDEIDIVGEPYLLYGENSNGNRFYVRMFNAGAFSGNRTDNCKSFVTIYGTSNAKVYHWVYGNGKIGNLNAGDENFYNGYFCFSDKSFSDI